MILKKYKMNLLKKNQPRKQRLKRQQRKKLMKMSQMAKQPNNVRGNQIGCINFQQCPICYGCRAYDDRYEECRECYEQGIDDTQRNFNVCNKELHESWKVNMMITKHTIELNENTEIKDREV